MSLLNWIITVGAAVSALGIIFQTIVKPVVKWAKRIETAVTIVEGNMVNNGGSSLRDAIDRIENRLTNLEDHVTKPAVGPVKKQVKKSTRSSTVSRKK